MQTATASPENGLFEELFPDGSLASTFVDLSDLDPGRTEHPDLTEAECDLLAGLRFEKRRRDWLGGRLAAKRAVRRLADLGRLDWRPRSLSEVQILPSRTREPIVYSSESFLPGHVQVSISHSGQFAGAVAYNGNQGRIGFDMERVEAADPALYQLAFRESEIREIETVLPALRPVAALVLWTAKEAISKALGTGLSTCLQDIELTLPEGLLQGGMRRFPGSLWHGSGAGRTSFVVDTCWTGEYVLSLASLSG